jgi:hypothetical protein
MASSERPNLNLTSPTPADLQAELAAVQNQLEIVDANENQIERLYQLNRLLELQDELQAEIDALAAPPERS